MKLLIVNADDFGASPGINRGILDCYTRGVVTSASLMVTGRAAAEAVELSRDYPSLGLGLHWDVWGEDERGFPLGNQMAVKEELARQLDAFHRLVGRLPTHVDSHRHAHRSADLMPLFLKMLEPLHIPLRGDGAVSYIGGFYAQWEWQVTNLEYISVPFLQWILREEVGEGWTEIACHPGYASPDFSSVYNHERAVEVQTLRDPRVLETIRELRIRLMSYADFRARTPCESVARMPR